VPDRRRRRHFLSLFGQEIDLRGELLNLDVELSIEHEQLIFLIYDTAKLWQHALHLLDRPRLVLELTLLSLNFVSIDLQHTIAV